MSAQHVAPTDGSVWKVVSKEGDSVSEGDEIVILESMKMEIPVIANASGTLTNLFVQEGQPVEEDDVIAEVE